MPARSVGQTDIGTAIGQHTRKGRGTSEGKDGTAERPPLPMPGGSKPRQGRGGQESVSAATRTGRAELPGEYIDGCNYHRNGAKKPLVAPNNSDDGDAHSAPFRVRPFVALLYPPDNNPSAGGAAPYGARAFGGM